jgi:CubicO group peptidase (beta-lactamase class C family)
VITWKYEVKGFMNFFLKNILVFGVLLAQPLNAASSGTEEVVVQLNLYLKELAAKNSFSGSVLLAKGDSVLIQEAYGMASKRFDVPNNVETKFNLASMNKMFTSVAIMQLVESGKLSLSDKLSKFLDESWLPKSISSEIEIKHLLSHSSGLDHYFNRTYRNTSKSNYQTLDDYKSLVVNGSVLFKAGTKSHYSNTGMLVLGAVIEKVSGQDYYSYIRENIYQKAGMVNSDSYELNQPIFNLATGYDPNKDNATGWQNNNFMFVFKGTPDGGGFSTVQDLHKFALALTNNKLLGKELTEQAFSVQSKLKYFNYGYGFTIRGDSDNRIVGHGGAFPGIGSNLDIYLEQGYIAVVMSNYGRGDREVRNKIRELLKK